jgi:hypothetical protein
MRRVANREKGRLAGCHLVLLRPYRMGGAGPSVSQYVSPGGWSRSSLIASHSLDALLPAAVTSRSLVSLSHGALRMQKGPCGVGASPTDSRPSGRLSYMVMH